MKIRRLLIKNFKGIQQVHMTDLEDVITIAGKNGCGKTCLLEGIRLLKSQYGDYNENENRAWWDEKQVDLHQAGAPRKVLRNKQTRAVVEAEIELTASEKHYVREDPNHLTEVMAVRMIAPGIESQIEYRIRNWSLQNWRAIPGLAGRANEVLDIVQRIKEDIDRDLAGHTTTGRFDIRPDGRIETHMNRLLSFVFGTFEPRRLGIIEFNPADRRYPPERFTNVTVDVEKQDEAWKQSAMYNTEGKYGGVKDALGNEWIRGIIRREAGETTATEEMVTAMREIFRDMIPDKEFRGPRPTRDGRLDFNVSTGGNEHDIDDLSSGEKEILFGYLKTRARAPKNSVIIVDEPELHMNPRMIAGLPSLYERHIGRALQNQVWLVTHSDMFLRRAFESGRMQVFHMDMPKDQDSSFNVAAHFADLCHHAAIATPGSATSARRAGQRRRLRWRRSMGSSACVTAGQRWRPQQELFHTSNSLYDANKQIVFSSDRPVCEWHGFEGAMNRGGPPTNGTPAPPPRGARALVLSRAHEY